MCINHHVNLNNSTTKCSKNKISISLAQATNYLTNHINFKANEWVFFEKSCLITFQQMCTKKIGTVDFFNNFASFELIFLEPI